MRPDKHPRRNWLLALRLIGEGVSYRGAAKASGIPFMTIYNRLKAARLTRDVAPPPKRAGG